MVLKPKIVKLFGQPAAPVEPGVPTPVRRKDALVDGELVWIEVYVALDRFLDSITVALGPAPNSDRISWWEEDGYISVTPDCPPAEAVRLRALLDSVLPHLPTS